MYYCCRTYISGRAHNKNIGRVAPTAFVEAIVRVVPGMYNVKLRKKTPPQQRSPWLIVVPPTAIWHPLCFRFKSRDSVTRPVSKVMVTEETYSKHGPIYYGGIALPEEIGIRLFSPDLYITAESPFPKKSESACFHWTRWCG